jgi:glycosyltransferase involved in cell wall biosynthesis
MQEKKANQFILNLKRFWHPINIYDNLKKFYFSIVPKGSKVYKFTHGFLSIFIKKLHLFNIYYQEWIRRFDTITDETKSEVFGQISAMENQPFISVVMPVYNPPEELLYQAIQSVINQIYPYWELCIADDASTNPRIPAMIKDFAKKDPRIKAILRNENGHISAASNSALDLVTKEYVALLDHDDLLHPLALYYVAQIIEKYPDSVIIYTDEDKITKKGRRLDPYFKPDFNYELFLSQNMISHLGVYRTETVRFVGGFRLGFEGSQDYDLALRVLEQSKPEQIHHIQRPLYHWRIIKASAANDLNVKPYAITAAQKALSEHLARRNVQAEVTFLPDVAAFRITYALSEPPPNISIVLPVDKLSNQIINIIDSIIKITDYPKYQIVLGLPYKDHNNSVDKLAKWNPIVKSVPYDNNIDNYASMVNHCVNQTSSELVCLLDRALKGYQPDWLRTLSSLASQPEIGAVAPRLIDQSGRVYSNGIILLPNKIFQHISQGEEQDLNGYFGWSKLTRGYSILSEKCLMFKKEHFVKSEGFNDSFQLPIFSGADFCLRLRELGYRNILQPSVELHIAGNDNQGDFLDDSEQSYQTDKQTFIEYWYNWVANDPAFNPNLYFTEIGKMLVNPSPNLNSLGD